MKEKEPSLSLRTKIMNELRELGIEPKKSLGQNFLLSDSVYKAIVEAANLSDDDAVIEIGPGIGTLTEYLVKTNALVYAIEKDRRLIDYLQKKFSDNQNIKIIEGDALIFKPGDENIKPPYTIVGNIPYYLTSHLLRVTLERWPHAERIVFMVQKEVAQRIIAKAPEMNLLGLSIQYYANATIVKHVKAGNFYPVPKIDSAIILIIPKKEPADPNFTKHFFALAKAAFSGKRKQLINTIAGLLHIQKEEVALYLNKVGIDPQRRPQTLSLEEWRHIVSIFYPHS